jgi:hypothetical protein
LSSPSGNVSYAGKGKKLALQGMTGTLATALNPNLFYMNNKANEKEMAHET